tara:strand:+ start:1614 stop:2183 length:570 start_codon:yes stop_codon:yes gene_type:complete
MALTSEVLFVNADYVKHYSHINESVEEAYLDSHVMLSQDKHCQTYLGTRLFEKLKADIRSGSLAGNYVTLMDNHVRKVTLWWTLVEMLPHLHVKIHNGGLVVRTSENATGITKADLNREMDNARENAQYYTQRMIDYLCNNTSLFPEYSASEPGDILPEKHVYSVAGYEVGGRKNPYRDQRFDFVYKTR